MGAKFRIRDVETSDREDLIRGYYALYDERDAGEPIGIVLSTERPSAESENRWFDGLMEALRLGGRVAAVAEVDGHAVGLCEVARRGFSPQSEVAHVGELGILVHRAHRGHGVGEALLRHVLERCQGRFDVVVLAVFADNARAMHLYEKVGFRRYGSLPRGIKRGRRYIDSVEMALDLSPASDGESRKSPSKLNRGTQSASAPSPSHGG